MLRLRSIFVGRLGHFCSVGQRTYRRTTLTAGDKWARLSAISCTTGPVCGTVGYDANSGSGVGTRRPRAHAARLHLPGRSVMPRALRNRGPIGVTLSLFHPDPGAGWVYAMIRYGVSASDAAGK